MKPSIAILRRLSIIAVLLTCPTVVVAQPATELVQKIQDLTKQMQELPIRKDDDELRKLNVEKYNTALQEVKQRVEDFGNKLTTLDAVMLSCRQLLQADLDVQTRPEDKIKVLEHALAIVKWFEGRLQQAVKDSVGSRAEVLRFRYRRLELEADIVKLRREMRAAPAK